jgi:hypothetical protein
MAHAVPWPDPGGTLAPTGFVASPVDPSRASPVCAPGYSVLMAPLIWIGGNEGAFLASPIFCVLLVWSAFAIGRRLHGPWTGWAGAVLVATSPIVLFQAMQPMNDIATAALWLSVVAVLTRPTPSRVSMGGALTGTALLVRPNLLPVALVPMLWIWADRGDSGRARRTRLALFAAGVAPFGMLVLGLNAALYGGALRSGYGDVGSLFAWSSIPTNARAYFATLVGTHTVFPLAALALPFLRRPKGFDPVWLALGTSAAIVAAYLPYHPFPEWWYLRFVLPAVALLLIVAVCSLATAVDVLSPKVGPALAFVVVAGVAAYQVQQARERDAFALHVAESRFRHTASAVRDRLPQSKAALAAWDSGSLRFHADLEAINWQMLAPDWLDRSVAWLSEHTGEAAIVVEAFEEPEFRQRFSGQTFGGLDWPPRLEVDAMVRVYVPSDRARYLAGTPVATEIIAERRRE